MDYSLLFFLLVLELNSAWSLNVFIIQKRAGWTRKMKIILVCNDMRMSKWQNFASLSNWHLFRLSHSYECSTVSTATPAPMTTTASTQRGREMIVTHELTNESCLPGSGESPEPCGSKLQVSHIPAAQTLEHHVSNTKTMGSIPMNCTKNV